MLLTLASRNITNQNNTMLTPSINTSSSTIKFLCSYGGIILPRYPDGKLRYHGGQTRVLAVQRSISFHELLIKLREICGESVGLLRCQLPTEDLDALVSITSDEDLSNIIEEYNILASSSSIKIRAFISVPKKLSPSTSFSTTPAASPSPSPSSSRSNGSISPPISTNNMVSNRSVSLRNQRLSICHMSAGRLGVVPSYHEKAAGKLPQGAYPGYNTRRQIYVVHGGNYWQ